MFKNDEPDVPHLYLWKRTGNVASESGSHSESGTVHLNSNILSGDFFVWVEYNNKNHIISIYVSKTRTKPENPTGTYSVNLGEIIGDTYYIGISASTGTQYQNHYIKEWGWTNKDSFIKSHVLTVVPNGGMWEEKSENQQIEINIASTREIPIPTRYGYTFTGWTLEGENSSMTSLTTESIFTMGTEDAVLTANWIPWTGQITINKTDSITKEKLSGAKFGLYEWNGTLYEKKYDMIDNENGSYESEKLIFTEKNQGKFKIVEEVAPIYYTYNQIEKEITLDEQANHEFIYNIENEPNKVKVKINKVDNETRNEIAGAEFTVYEYDVTTNEYKEYKRNGNIVKLQYNEDKKIYLSDWLYSNKTNEGKFRVVETKTPDGYFGDWSNLEENQKVNNDFTIDLNSNGKILVLQNNEKDYINERVKGTINLSKIDIETKKILSQGDATLDGAVYGLYAAEDIIHKDTVTGKIYDKDQIVQEQTVLNGKITFDNVEIGNYYIKEIVAPEGYIIDNKKYNVSIDYEGEQVKHIERNVIVQEKVKKQAFSIQKLSTNSGSQEGKPLANAGFKIYLIRDLIEVKNGKITKDEKGNYNPADFIGYDFSKEQTALDYSNSSDGERICEIFTNQLGQVTSPELAYGQYVIIESTVPMDRYEVNPFIIEIKEDSRTAQNFKYLLDREFESLIKVKKLDRSSRKEVLNKSASYRIWSITEQKYVEQTVTYPTPKTYGTEENPYKTNEYGYFITPLLLQIGEYELREVKAPEGYILQGNEGVMKNGNLTQIPSKPVKFTISSSNMYYQDAETNQIIIDVNQYNDQMLGELKIVKKGEYLVGTEKKEDGSIDFKYELKAIEGAEFKVYAKETIYSQDNQGNVIYNKNELVGTIGTNAQGIGYLDNLPIGKYYIKEIQAGKEFVLNKEVKEFEVKYQGEKIPVQEIEIDYKNERQKINLNGEDGLLVEKKANKKLYIPGEEVKYTIKVCNTSQNIIKNIVVKENINGEFEETNSKNVKKVDFKTVEINELSPGESEVLTFKTRLQTTEINEKVKITNKVKAVGIQERINLNDPHNPIKEEVIGEDEEDIYVVDESKKLIIIKESLKESYVSGEIAQYVIRVINKNEKDIEDVIVNESMIGGRFVDLDGIRKNGLKLKYGKNEIGKEDFNQVIIEKINPGEEVILKYEYPIPDNIEKIVQNKVEVKGIIKNNSIEEVIEDADEERIEIKEEKGIGIIKEDIKTGEKVEGAILGLYSLEDIKGIDGNILVKADTLIEKSETNKEGKAIFNVDLPLGKYYLQEMEAPDKYTLSKEKVIINGIYRGQEVEVINVSSIIANRSRQVKVIKKDTQGNLVIGAELEVLDENNNIVYNWNTSKEVNILEKLEKGKIYTLKEKKAPSGYISIEEIKFFIGEDEKLYQRIEDEELFVENLQIDYLELIDEKTVLTVRIIDVETKKDISNMLVQIVDKDGKIVYTYISDGTEKKIEGLPIGEYRIISKDGESRGYITTEAKQKISDHIKNQTLILEQEYTKIEISLKEENKNFLSGGLLELINKNGEVILEIKTTDESYKVERIPLGKYTIKQIKTKDGYFMADNKQIQIKDMSNIQKFEIYNKKKKFDFSINKEIVLQDYNKKRQVVNEKLTKFEIRPANIPMAEAWYIYKITVKNEGELEGTAVIKEEIPKGFNMYQESNTAWIVQKDTAILNTGVIKPGEIKEYEVSLRWNNNVTNIGVKENKVQIISTKNNAGFSDIDMSNNSSSASVLVAISTGLDTKIEIIIITSLLIAIIGIIMAFCIIINRSKHNK